MATITQADIDALKASGQFDAEWYLATYKDVAMMGMDPAEHYLKFGFRMARQINAGTTDSAVELKARSAFNGEQSGYAKGLSPAQLDVFYRNSSIDHLSAGLFSVSVVITNHNNEKYLARAINSALSQVHVDVKVIVVDDGSSDQSVKLAREMANHDARISVCALLKNFGAYFARNIGILEAKSEFVAFIDSDDIIHPERLVRQINAIVANNDISMSLCKLRRWSEDFSEPLREKRIGEVTLVARKSLFDELGYFDSVKFGADTEFRKRVERRRGVGSVSLLEDELYFARSVPTSLTMSGKGKIFTIQNGSIAFEAAEARTLYEGAFKDWHKNVLTGEGSQIVKFPQFKRPFPVKEEGLIASPFLNQPVIGFMATFPERMGVLERNIPNIVKQVDVLNIYLNGYDEIPSFLINPKIKCTLASSALGDLRDNGKFYNIENAAGYVFTFDDDLIYPPDYVSRLVIEIEKFNRSAVVGVHGVVFNKDEEGYLDNRRVFHFVEGHRKCFVDLLGTGTVAFHSSTLSLRIEDFKTKGICDLWFARLCQLQYVPMLSVDRPAGWLADGGEKVGTKLYKEAKSNAGGHNELYCRYLRPLTLEGQLRRHAFKHYVNCFGVDAMTCAGFDIGEVSDKIFEVEATTPIIKISLMVNGWNCAEFVNACLRSLAEQKFGRYDLSLVLLDDGSTDDTFNFLDRRSSLPSAAVFRNGKNMGAAFTRHFAINTEVDPDSVIVLLDLDDELFPDALRKVAAAYLEDTNCLVTCGNWRSERRVNPLSFYVAADIDSQKVRDVESFQAAPLRTFKRFLYDAVDVSDLKGPEGEWLQTCTDVAIMYSILDQVYSKNVFFFKEPLYFYNEKLSQGTLARFGKSYKVERLNWLKRKDKKIRHPRALGKGPVI